jgi:hypothetical protein
MVDPFGMADYTQHWLHHVRMQAEALDRVRRDMVASPHPDRQLPTLLAAQRMLAMHIAEARRCGATEAEIAAAGASSGQAPMHSA